MALADAIRDLILSPDNCKKMGETAACRVKKRFSQQQMITQVAALYDEILNARS
jgi:glycosyltransferase involved in cell wall biosynthesis